MTPNQLRWEIENGPLASELAGYWVMRNFGMVAEALNQPRYAQPASSRFVSIGEFSQWLTVSGIRFKFRAAERNESTSTAARDLIDVVFGLERNPHVSVVDPTAAASIVSGLKQQSVISTTDEAAFAALIASPTRYASRAEQIAGRPISAEEIREASTVQAEQ
jgi:hypothetical protein